MSARAPASGADTAAALVARLVRPEIRALAAYHVPDAAGLVKLDAMENPYPLPEALVEAWLERLRGVALNRYPDADATRLKAALRRAFDVPEAAAIALGNGSDELIQLAVLTFAAPAGTVLAPEPSFSMYALLTRALGLRYAPVPLAGADFALDACALVDAIERERPAVVFLAYPNNPTGNLFDDDVVEAALDAAPGVVIVDEAYAPFADATFMDRLPERANLLVLRTVSKLGLAGLRLGALAGHPDLLAEIEKLRLPYNVNALTQASAEFALEHLDAFDAQTAAIRRERDALYARLAAEAAIETWPSRANFVLFRVPAGTARAVWESMRRDGVLVKNLDGLSPALADCLRVTAGTREENERFLEALRRALAGST